MTVSEPAHSSLLVALAALLCCPLLATPAVGSPPAAPSRAAAPGLERLPLRVDPGQGPATDRGAAEPVVRSATVRVGRGSLVRGWRTAGFRQVGATWRGSDPVLAVRTRAARGGWSAWQELEPLHDGPGVAAAEGRDGLRASGLWWAGPARDLQLRVRGRDHRDLRLVLIDPGASTGAADSAALRSAPASRSGVRTAAVTTAAVTTAAVTTANTATTASTVSAARPTRAPRPRLFSRRTWGADESWRDGRPSYNRRLEQVHVHHTVNSNAYSRSDVAPMIRGMYRYHTQSLGWSDIGYNFLVDRFGRAWVGRAGGPGRKVRGAHTLGFNENGTGVAVIGNFERARAPRPARWKVAEITAWKLDAVGKNPSASARVWSHGSDRYRRGTRPRLPRVAGHRDTNETACPGHYLYQQLGGIRSAAQQRVNRFS